ncbi:MAG TPA: endonuclease/exonuclease/phosphatase family protein [Caldimonas sp.]|nr:endonuclease/exonuclease/phosphatase family protein [Caldimonas sp.]HEX2542742.1 endonuclease/exonuclease/phosphatase family protein [Caldimonas sp.]
MSNQYAGLRRAMAREKGAVPRCAERLLAIRERLAPLRRRRSDASLLLATWNIRDFDSNRFGFGPRRPETFYYLAEMIACFDLVAVQEVSRDLSALQTLMRILGREWDYIATDTTEGSGGNGERMAFLYNTEKVWFRRIAGEIVLPDGQLVVSPKKVKPPKYQPRPAASDEAEAPVDADAAALGAGHARQQFARSPFLVAFQSGWFRFSLCTVHIYYGAASGAALQRRIAEIERLVHFFAARQDDASQQEKDSSGEVENYILLGDFNVVSPEHKTMAALKSEGFTIPAAIDGRTVRRDGSHFYDQIAVRVKDKRFKVVGGGMVDMFADVFRDNAEDRAIYAAHVPKKDPERDAARKASTAEALYLKWRTWQMSDHSPLWIEIETDFADSYLRDIAADR